MGEWPPTPWQVSQLSFKSLKRDIVSSPADEDEVEAIPNAKKNIDTPIVDFI